METFTLLINPSKSEKVGNYKLQLTLTDTFGETSSYTLDVIVKSNVNIRSEIAIV